MRKILVVIDAFRSKLCKCWQYGEVKVFLLIFEPLQKFYINFLMDLQCLPITWYLSVDFQMYLLSPFLVYGIYRFGTKGYLLIIAMILASIVYHYKIALEKGFVSRELDV